MHTYRSIISRVRSLFKLVSSDVILTDRVILAEILATNMKLCVQSLQKRSNWSSPNLFTVIACIPMEEVALYQCCNTQSNCTIARSKVKVPQIVDCNYSLVINYVTSLDKKFRYKELLSADRYTNYLKLYPEGTKDKFYWIQDNYIYVTDSDVEKITISAFFVDPIDPIKYSCTKQSSCINPIDLEFKSLPKVEDDIINIVAQKLLNTYKKSKEDITENDIDETK